MRTTSVRRAVGRVCVCVGGRAAAADTRPRPRAVDHSIVMYFLGPKGEFLDFFTQLAEPAEIVERMAAHMRKTK